MSAGRRGIIGKSGNATWAKVMGFYIGNSRVFIAAHHFSHGGAARAFFHGIMHAAGHGEAHAKKRNAYNEKNEDGAHDGKFNGRGATLVATYVGPEMAHG